MLRPSIALAALALTALGAPPDGGPFPRFKEEAMTIEYTATNGEAAIVLQAETEQSIARLEVRSPLGEPVLDMSGPSGRPLALSGFVLESIETTPQELATLYPAGVYSLRGRTTDGRAMRGHAMLSHALPPAPQVTFPTQGAVDVPANNLRVRWAAEPQAARYRVVLEQGDADNLMVELPRGSTSLVVPDGVLAPGTDTLFEVGAVGANGNCTIVEITFKTR